MRLAALAVLAASLLAAAIYHMAGFATAAVFILFGLAYGFLLQWGKICFATAFYGWNLALTRAILLSILTASAGALALEATGFTVPSLPPASLHIFLGSVLFGVGMALAGGCITGTIFRLGSGSLQHAVAFVGILTGAAVGVFATWPIAELFMQYGARPWLLLGPHISFVINAAVVFGAVLYLYRKEGTRPFSDLRAPVYIAAILFAALWVIQFATYGALITQVPITRAVVYTASLQPPESWVSFAGGLRPPPEDPLLLLIMAMIAGAAVSALYRGEYLGFSKVDKKSAIVAFAGGFLMGLGAWLAVGCNVSGFYSATAALRVEGWLYALGLLAGAIAGLKIRARL
ncbi:MAG: YeeE/YedE thiosulfate transporter family protein [Pyrobaculum sp.]